MSIFSTVADRIPTEFADLNTQQIGLMTVDQEGGEPLVGIAYRADYKCEEETGLNDMTTRLTGSAAEGSFFRTEREKEHGVDNFASRFAQIDFVHQTDRFVVFATTPNPLGLERSLAHGAAFIGHNDSRAAGLDWRVQSDIEFATVTELKAMAKESGLTGYSKLGKTDLQRLILADKIAALAPTNAHAAWFQTGDFLVIPRTNDLFGEVLDLLVDAATEGYLAVGGSGVAAFASGFSFFDERDLSDVSKESIATANDEHREDMAALAPVAEMVKARLGTYYALHPNRWEDGTTKYFLNGGSVILPSGNRAQPYGWYTLEELRDEKYITDADERFTSKVA